MRFTKIRRKKGKLTRPSLGRLCALLQNQAKNAGFDCRAEMVNSSGIKLTGPHRGKGPQRREYNYRLALETKKGYRRTTKPTWEQYVDLNSLVNYVLDCLDVSSNVVSGQYNVRQGHRAFQNWFDLSDGIIYSNEDIVKEYVAEQRKNDYKHSKVWKELVR